MCDNEEFVKFFSSLTNSQCEKPPLGSRGASPAKIAMSSTLRQWRARRWPRRRLKSGNSAVAGDMEAQFTPSADFCPNRMKAQKDPLADRDQPLASLVWATFSDKHHMLASKQNPRLY